VRFPFTPVLAFPAFSLLFFPASDNSNLKPERKNDENPNADGRTGDFLCGSGLPGNGRRRIP